MSETVVVTGGAGFIGSHIVDAFVQAGYDVAVVDNLRTGTLANVHAAARFYEVDICDGEAVERVFSREEPAVVSHQAALANVQASLADPVEYATVNLIGTLNVLESARRHGTRRVLLASTGGAVYGEPAELPASETCPTRPLDPYGASKLACEVYLDTFRHNYGLSYCVLRYANVYGPRQASHGEAGVVAIFVTRMLRGEQVIIHGDGLQQRDFVYVGDIARANLQALEKGSGIYNLGSEIATDINTLFRHLAHLTGYALAEVHGPAKPGEVRYSYLNAERARRELQWSPRIALSEGLARTVSYYRASRDAVVPHLTAQPAHLSSAR
jgi:UDP-glucose 4-epimerase